MVATAASRPALSQAAFPRRDEDARRRLRVAATQAAPAVLAGARQLTVPGPIGAVLPAGGIRRGATVALDGPPGSGSTTVALGFLAATTFAGEWAAVVDPDATFGARAAADAGVALERCAIVRRVPSDRWSSAVAALLDGVALVVAAVPPHLRPGDARRLTARARERAAVLVALGPWPAEANVRLRADGRSWQHFTPGPLQVRVERNGAARHARLG